GGTPRAHDTRVAIAVQRLTPRVRTSAGVGWASDRCRRAASADRYSAFPPVRHRSPSARRTCRVRDAGRGPKTRTDPTPGSSADRRADSGTTTHARTLDPARAARAPA